jgi:hypothetical protein
VGLQLAILLGIGVIGVLLALADKLGEGANGDRVDPHRPAQRHDI